jgi:hypothetical protein
MELTKQQKRIIVYMYGKQAVTHLKISNDLNIERDNFFAPKMKELSDYINSPRNFVNYWDEPISLNNNGIAKAETLISEKATLKKDNFKFWIALLIPTAIGIAALINSILARLET